MAYIDTEIAEMIGISEATLYVWKKRHPEFAEAIARGRIPVDIEITEALRRSSLGGLVKEEKAFKVRRADGGEEMQVVEVSRHIEADPRAQIFWLKNRQRAKWKDFKQVESSGLDGAPIQHEVTSKGVEAALNRLIGIFGGKT